nr:MAG TPA: hypothetical protein [Caudoviricetes sp.]
MSLSRIYNYRVKKYINYKIFNPLKDRARSFLF